MSRNFSFFILGLIAAILAYVFYPALIGGLELIITERLPRDFSQMLQNSGLVIFAGSVSLFGLSFFLLYLIFPVFYVWYHINSAKGIIADLPLISNVAKRTDKKKFLSALKDLGFVGKLARSYGPYLIQGPEEEVSPDVVKNIRLTASRGKDQKLKILPVSATVPAEVVFNVDSLVTDNLLLGFFAIFARMMIGAGVVCLGISVISFSLVLEESGIELFSALQPGMMAFLYLLVSAIIMIGLTGLVNMILSQNAGAVARMVNGLFHQNAWQRDMGRITAHLEGDSAVEKIEAVLKNSLDKPMKEISKAVKELAQEQEQKLDNILSTTLDNFSENLMKKSGSNMEDWNKSLKDVTQAADQMKKQFTSANSEFSKQMNKQSVAIAKHLTDMQKTLGNSEKVTQAGTEKIVSSLSTEVENSYKNFAKYMESSLKKLDAKQAMVEKSSQNKDGILKDLHDTAKDLATISNASGMLLERFITLTTELDSVLRNIRENGITHYNDNAEKRDKLKSAMAKLQKNNKDKIGELPDM